MPVSILQSPTTPNVTGTNLVYTLSSPSSSNAQYRYVTDIYQSGSGDFITRIRTYPNLHGSGIIDVSRELDDQLDYDLNWQVTGSIQPVQSVKTFDIRFGEEYAPSYSGSITQYTGSTPNYLQVFPGEVYKNEGSYNFNTSSLRPNLILSNVPTAKYSLEISTGSPNNQFFLPLGPDANLVLGVEDYHTITIYAPNPPFNNVYINCRDIDGFTLEDLLLTVDPNTKFQTIGIGPKNFLDWGVQGSFDPAVFLNPNLAQVNVSSQTGGPNYNYIYKGGPLDSICSSEYTRFAFINAYGFWDYYNIYNPLRSNNQVDRSLYDRSFVRYEDTIGSYNINDRGTTQYRTEYNNRYKITTDYIGKQTSQWLTELFESPEVFIQQNGNFVPINITNTNIRWNMNTSREKLFQYDIEFKYANQPQPR